MMSEPQSEFDPAPVVPLSYYGQQGSAFAPAVKFAGWMGIAYCGMVIGSEVMYLLTLVWQQSVGPAYTSGTQMNLIYGLLPACAAGVLLAGSIMTVQLRRAGRTLVLWSSAIISVCWVAVFLFTTAQYASRYMPAGVKTAGLGNSLLVIQTVSGFISMMYRSYVPVMLWIAFRRREVRDVFERA